MQTIQSIRISSLPSVMKCKRTVWLKDLPNDDENDEAKQGTAAAEYLEHLIKGTNPIPLNARNGWFFDAEIKTYITSVFEKHIPKDRVVESEKYVSWFTRSGIKIEGTLDVAYEHENGSMLCIDDLKFGYLIIDPVLNYQLIGYTIGKIHATGKAYPKYRLRIIQPRAHHYLGPVREWVITHEELLKYNEEIEKQCMEIVQGDQTASTSSACRYCKANNKITGHVCNAFNESFYASLEYTFNHHPKDILTEDEISKELDLVKRAKEILKTKESSLEALAVNRIKENNPIPNYISEPSYGKRKWRPGVNPDTVKILTNGKVDITEKSMLSPNQAVQLGLSEDLVSQLCERHYSGHKLTRVDVNKYAQKIFDNKNNGGK